MNQQCAGTQAAHLGEELLGKGCHKGWPRAGFAFLHVHLLIPQPFGPWLNFCTCCNCNGVVVEAPCEERIKRINSCCARLL